MREPLRLSETQSGQETIPDDDIDLQEIGTRLIPDQIRFGKHLDRHIGLTRSSLRSRPLGSRRASHLVAGYSFQSCGTSRESGRWHRAIPSWMLAARNSRIAEARVLLRYRQGPQCLL